MKIKNKNIIICLILTIVLTTAGGTSVFAYTHDSPSGKDNIPTITFNNNQMNNPLIVAETTGDGIETPAPEEEPDPPSIVIQDYPATLYVGETAKLSSLIRYTDDEDVSWSSSNSNVISIDGDGNITAESTGSAKITAKISGASDSVDISVKEKKAERISIASDDLGLTGSVTGYRINKGDRVQLRVDPNPSDATVSGIRWEVDNDELAEIDSDGVLTALKDGNIIVTVNADDGLSDSMEIQIGSSIPWMFIIIAAAILLLIIVLIALIIRKKRRRKRRKGSKSKTKKPKKYYDNEVYDDADDDEYYDPEAEERERERIRQEAYRKGFNDRDKEMTKVFNPKDFETHNDDDIE